MIRTRGINYFSEHAKAHSFQSGLLLSHSDKISHRFFSRRGGLCSGARSSLSYSINERGTDIIQSNLSIASAALGTKYNIKLSMQRHTANFMYVPSIDCNTYDVQCDALITDKPGIAIGIFTADCIPILVTDISGTVIAAIHAGWRGLIGGVIKNTINAMNVAHHKLIAAIGPCICKYNYEVDSYFRENFLLHDNESSSFFIPLLFKDQKYLFDLSGYAALIMKRSGVQLIDKLNIDTFSNPDLLFSYRRSSKIETNVYGCQISAITIN
ncbi:Polyphenol oxidase family protein [Candidatus Cyrtobacter comes]|uniref:Purine nucleoside phosphorylase n=1 Tax=Candidatus Cyrtobacter comes TaxID=675776 RepID=A0ABU5L6Z8_9RICK|nr:peptidoglycan editing factor PgeF [Candidatus Cyrtobacter comes]MDZ5761650.1 Polyphenol oxidase family protein [Candidatus Cyrtobacter comes]